MDDAMREEFRDFVAARSPALLRTAYLMTGQRQDAEDLLQTSLAKTLVAWRRVRSADNPEAYVRRLMLNTRTSLWRRHRHEAGPVADPPDRPDSADHYGDADLHDALWAALATLGRRQRAVLVLRYYEGLSEAEIADALGVSVGTVKSQASRALAALRTNAGLLDDVRATLPLSSTSGVTS
ncbi:MAG TPA: SigE family RNA polymerase sigma factor [Mycobacteriales bacterium]|nr:SigE family RNA polymerase sigma factor [Mycobacteriales bacterium]